MALFTLTIQNGSSAQAHSFELPVSEGLPSIAIYAADGRMVKKITAESFHTTRNATWDGHGEKGMLSGNGTYMVSVEAGTAKESFPVRIVN
jgi:flagellar hook assembly protein FlgD